MCAKFMLTEPRHMLSILGKNTTTHTQTPTSIWSDFAISIFRAQNQNQSQPNRSKQMLPTVTWPHHHPLTLSKLIQKVTIAHSRLNKRNPVAPEHPEVGRWNMDRQRHTLGTSSPGARGFARE